MNEARLSFTRQVQIPRLNPDSQVATSTVQQRLRGLNFFLVDPPTVAPNFSVGVTGGSLFWGPQAWQNAINGGEAITLLDNLTRIMGRHTLRAGFMVRRDRGFFLDQGPAQLNFGGGLTNDPVTGQGGNGLAQFLLGAVDEGSAGNAPIHSRGQRQWYHAFYGQDDFRVKPNLTLNIGLRWDFFGWPYEDHDFVVDTNLSQPNGQVPFMGKAVYFGTNDHPNRAYFSPYNNSLGPRFNFSWSPFGGRRTVIRGGYGLIYSNAIETAMAPQITTSSEDCCGTPLNFYGDYTYQRPAFQLSQGIPPVTYVDPAAQIQQGYQWLGQGINHMTRGSKDPYVQQWSLYVQRELPRDMMLSVGYVGSRGEHLFTDNYRNLDHIATATRLNLRYNINNAVPVDKSLGAIYNTPSSPNTCPPDANPALVDCPGNLILKPYPQWSNVTSNLVGDGFSIYHSLQTKFEKRYSHGLDFVAAYTIQKTIVSQSTGSLLVGALTPSVFNSNSGRTGLVAGGRAYEGVEDPDNRRRYNALSVYDIPQVLNVAINYELPAGKGKPFLNSDAAVGKILGGWRLIQNWNLQSGVPLEFSGPCNAVSCKPNLIGDPSSGRGRKNRQQLENQWFNPAAFEAPFGSDPTVIYEVTNGTTPQGQPVDFNALNPYWRFGNSGLHLPTGRSPGFWNADIALTKNFHFTESRYFEFKWELFNAFNHQNLSLPNTNWCLPPNADGSVDAVHRFGCQFGKITGIQTDPRDMEFALKFYW